MADVNHVILIGRLTRDAELKYTSGGMAVCKFAIAVNRKKKQGENWVEEASFFDIVLWGRTAETLNQYLVKGKQVAIEGELHQNRWEQDGQSRSKIEIMASNVQLLGGGQNTNGQNGGQSNGNQGAESGRGATQKGAKENPYQKRSEKPKSGAAEQSQGQGDGYVDDDIPPDFPDDIPF